MSTYLTMTSRIDEYLAMRRQVGVALGSEGEFLKLFARFADRAGHHGAFSTQIAVRWATALRTPNSLTSANRMLILRRFAVHWRNIEPETEIPVPHMFGRMSRRLTPHIYTSQEVCDLVAAADNIGPPGCLRATTSAAIFGLLAATGMRVSEVINLKRADVQLASALLHIQHAKFGKSRWVPIHPSVVEALAVYTRRRDLDRFSSGTDSFFVLDHGRAVTYDSISLVFRRLRAQLKWQARGGHPAPRIHDIRHTFVCSQLERWARSGSVDNNILALSTYVGHVKVSKTYWYATGTPELLAIAAKRFEPTGECV